MKNQCILGSVYLTLFGLTVPATLSAQADISTIPYQGRVEVDGEAFTGTGEFNFMLLSKNPLTSSPTQATADVTAVVGGGIDKIIISNEGSGYTSNPEVTLSGGGGTGATALASISSVTGKVLSIVILEPGSGYTSNPTLTLTPPQPAEVATWTNEDRKPTSTARPAVAETLSVSNGVYSVYLGDEALMPHLEPFDLHGGDLYLRVWFSDGVNGFQQLSPDQRLGATPYAHIARSVLGRDSVVGEEDNVAMGLRTTASGVTATAMGSQTLASGAYSTAMGLDTTASGSESTAMGDGTIASGNNSTAMGFESIASGSNAFSAGHRTTASNNDATALGDATIASGNNSTSMGLLTVASGRTATAMGSRTSAPSFCETAIGMNGTLYNPLSEEAYSVNDRLFSIGNGLSSSLRSNALTMLKNGHTEVQAAPASNNEAFPENFAWLIESTISEGDVLALKTSDKDVTSASKFVSFFSGSDVVLGEIEGNGTGGVVYRSNGADYAELLLPHDLNETFAPGDIVAVSGGKITKDTSTADQMMVISTRPIMLGNSPPGDDSSHQKVAFIGQTPVKVIGTVNSGDYLLASGKDDGSAIAKDGSALTLADRSLIVGRAWDSSEESEEKLVNAAIGLDLGPALASEVKSLRQRVKALEEMEARLARVETLLEESYSNRISQTGLSQKN